MTDNPTLPTNPDVSNTEDLPRQLSESISTISFEDVLNFFTVFANLDEVQHFHPLVADYLSSQGFEFEHEVTISNAGRVDFVAHKDNEEWLIECKLGDQLLTAADQLRRYRSAWKNPDVKLWVFQTQDNEGCRSYCQKLGIELTVIPIEEKRIGIRAPEENHELLLKTSILMSKHVAFVFDLQALIWSYSKHDMREEIEFYQSIANSLRESETGSDLQ